jgi:hypothetical protein
VVQRPLYPVASGSAVPPVYRWLAHQPAGVVAELPMCRLPGAYCLEESTYMYYSTYHWHPLANGGGGFFPQGWDAETASADQFPAPSALAALEGGRVRYVVVHPNYPGIAAACALVGPHAGYVRIGAARVESYRLGNDLVFVLPSTTHTGADNG